MMKRSADPVVELDILARIEFRSEQTIGLLGLLGARRVNSHPHLFFKGYVYD